MSTAWTQPPPLWLQTWRSLRRTGVGPNHLSVHRLALPRAMACSTFCKALTRELCWKRNRCRRGLTISTSCSKTTIANPRVPMERHLRKWVASAATPTAGSATKPFPAPGRCSAIWRTRTFTCRRRSSATSAAGITSRGTAWSATRVNTMPNGRTVLWRRTCASKNALFVVQICPWYTKELFSARVSWSGCYASGVGCWFWKLGLSWV